MTQGKLEISAMRFTSAPRLEVMLIPLEKAPGKNSLGSETLYEVYLVLHVPDGKPPTTLRLDHGPFDQDGAYNILLAAYATLGEKYAQSGARGDVKPSSEYDAKIDKADAGQGDVSAEREPGKRSL
jgi:hypothetical protein